MKKGILIVSFGTSNTRSIKRCIQSIENKARAKFKNFHIKRAFTSNVIIKRLEEKGIHIDTVGEALEKLKDEGFEEVFIQPLHIIPGHEYEKIINQVDKYNKEENFKRLKVSTPLLFEEMDCKRIVNAFEKDINSLEKNQDLVLMGHGTSHKSNKYYEMLEKSFRKKGYGNIHLGTLKEYKPIEEIISILKEKENESVRLQPFMLVAGRHVEKDMVGKEDSWKEKLENSGFVVETVVEGLGGIEKFQDIFLQKLNNLIYK